MNTCRPYIQQSITHLSPLLSLILLLTAPVLADTPVPGPWKIVTDVRPFAFPADHAAHEDYRIEWWYYTGNVKTDDGRWFGYQLTFFRTGVVHSPESKSRWAIRDLYIAHFAISDIAAEQFHCFQRVNRRGVGWAGADRDRYRAWNGDWEVRLEGDQHVLTARDGSYRLDLRLVSQKPPALHGNAGISPKGPSRGNASYYYSLTRMKTTGTLTVADKTFAVSGLSWMDHEFSSSFLEPGEQGWDWLSLQLDDGRDLMLYRIRRSDGTVDAASSATLVLADGRTQSLGSKDFTLTPGRTWHSSASETTYPVAWTLRVPNHGIELSIQASFPSQEMNTAATTGFAYWEGSITANGTAHARPIQARGYLEMTGYKGPGMGPIVEGEKASGGR
jgi:predicted secreted hydrolase